jgi:hypothetical protein
MKFFKFHAHKFSLNPINFDFILKSMSNLMGFHKTINILNFSRYNN